MNVNQEEMSNLVYVAHKIDINYVDSVVSTLFSRTTCVSLRFNMQDRDGNIFRPVTAMFSLGNSPKLTSTMSVLS